ncbi:MAG TPA: choice-of-anchor Q domain-containing protein [Jatrophihabitans sp.]|nr:choice-of-anchor Q domain-containing protein [Jatrophihabitans sp.]
MQLRARRRTIRSLLIGGALATGVVAAGGSATPAAGAATTIAFVQGAAFGTGAQVTSTTVRLAAPVAAGDLLVGWFSQYKVAGDVTVSDDVNGAWTRAPAALPFGSSGDNALYYLQGSAASASGVTITVSAPAAAYLQGTIAEYSGVAAVGALDSTATGKGVGTAVQTSATGSVPAGDLVYSALVTGGSAGAETPGASAGVRFTAHNALGSGGAYEQDITNGAAGTQVGAATLAKSTDWYAVVAAFRPAGTSVTPEPPSAPTGLTQVDATSAQVKLGWTASTDNVPITSYTIYRNGVRIGTSSTTGYTDGAVAASTTYSYTVSATNSAGQQSPQSAPLQVTTPSGAAACSAAGLVAAIAAANTGAGGGQVNLQSGCVYTLAAADNSAEGGNGLPVITGNLTIEGNGATIERSGDSSTPHFRILDVAAGANVTINNLTLRNGVADNGHDGGGAIWNHGSLSINGSTFDSNSNPATTGTSGGAIQNAGTLIVTRCTFTNNTAMEGGGVFNQSTTTIRQSTFANNTATVYGGGAILNAYGTTTVVASTFTGNSGPGGGVIDNDTTIIVSDSTMYGNTGGSHGGGAIQNFGTVKLTTSTIAGNSSPYGANLYNYGTSSLTVSDSIVAGGIGGNNCGGTAVNDAGNNLDSGSSCGFRSANNSRSGVDPQLQPAAANGGPTRTMALGSASPALDLIPAADAGCTGTTDQRGTARPQGGGCDVGAYELVPSSAPPPVPHRVQGGVAGTGSKVISTSVQLPAPVAAGDLLVGWFGQYDSAGQVQVADNVNGTWTRAPGSTTTFGNGRGDIALYYVQNAAAAPSGVTVTVSSSAATYLQAVVADYTSVSKTAAIDSLAVAKGVGATPDSGPTASATTGELLFSALMTGSSPGGATVPAGWVLHDHTGGYSIDDADALVAAAGPQHATWTLANAVDWYEVAAVVRGSSGG